MSQVNNATAVFEIKYYAPFTFANQKFEAVSVEEAKETHRKFCKEEAYCISNREIKSIKFNGKKVPGGI